MSIESSLRIPSSLIAVALSTSLMFATLLPRLAHAAGTLTTLAETNLTVAALLQATDGNFYGVSIAGGANNNSGVVFKITPGGVLTTLYNFCSQPKCADGVAPYAALIQATDGNLYGTTEGGGANNAGTVFKITLDGALTTLYSFCSEGTYPNCADGESPFAGLVQMGDGDLYGETSFTKATGADRILVGGTVFKMTLGGKLTTLYTFCSEGAWPNCPDGSQLQYSLGQGKDGSFYGVTEDGGLNNDGTVFKITPQGFFMTLHSFNGADGFQPAGLIEASSGNFYGTTVYGGANSAMCASIGCGTAYEITPGGILTTLYSFCSEAKCTDGKYAFGPTVQAANGELYGLTSQGGQKNSLGTVFRLSPKGELFTMFRFTKTTTPEGGGLLIQGTDGAFYGTAPNSVFKLSFGLGPFVETQTTSGKAGSTVGILGNNLTNATSVVFNGISATFDALSDSEIAAVVPRGASTGFVEVFLTGGIVLKSNKTFKVSD
jgi:uncharacterized repeat protein (TIGR03803 family)